MKDYKPSAGFGDDEVEKGATSGKKEKKKKDPNAPKVCMVAVFNYIQ
jgi:hypothetical protein